LNRVDRVQVGNRQRRGARGVGVEEAEVGLGAERQVGLVQPPTGPGDTGAVVPQVVIPARVELRLERAEGRAHLTCFGTLTAELSRLTWKRPGTRRWSWARSIAKTIDNSGSRSRRIFDHSRAVLSRPSTSCSRRRFSAT